MILGSTKFSILTLRNAGDNAYSSKNALDELLNLVFMIIFAS